MEYAFSFQKILDGNGLAISITGMFIVFFALLTIALSVFILPKILKIYDKFFPETGEESALTEPLEEGKEMIAAIGFALLKSK